MRRYYTFNVVGGLDENGEGVVFSYDAVGCFERLKYTVRAVLTSVALETLAEGVLPFC